MRNRSELGLLTSDVPKPASRDVKANRRHHRKIDLRRRGPGPSRRLHGLRAVRAARGARGREPVEQKKKFVRARLKRVLEPSPERMAPPCRTSARAAAAITSTFPTRHSSSTKWKFCARRCGALAKIDWTGEIKRTRRRPGAIAIARNGRSPFGLTLEREAMNRFRRMIPDGR